MAVDVSVVLADIDSVLNDYEAVDSRYKSLRLDALHRDDTYIFAPEDVNAEIITAMEACLRRNDLTNSYGKRVLAIPFENSTDLIRGLAGVLRALANDYRSGRIRPLIERIHSDMFSDFLEMAEYLIEDEGLKDPAAVLAGGVLEQHVRKLCDKAAPPIPTTFPDASGKDCPKKLDTMNTDLKKANIYGSNEQKQVTAWAAIRNSAAHAKYNEYTADQVKLMIQGLRQFLQTYRA